ncbi:MAG: hypothetical protein AB7O24_26100 [Kofleriaceae bacterium]
MTPTTRKRLAHSLAQSLDAAEQMAIAVDGGFGELAMAAIEAQPRGSARELEAATWARRATARGLDSVVTIVRPGASDDWVDAHGALLFALEQQRTRAEGGV